MLEEWKEIPGTNGLYCASTLGRIKSLPRQTTKGGILRQCGEAHNYMALNICLNGKPKISRVHRLVAKTFLDDYSESLDVDHINGDRSDNRVSNLRMATRSGNMMGKVRQRKHLTSKFRGVCKPRNMDKFLCQIGYLGKNYRIGAFESEVNAAIAYDIKAIGFGYKKEALNF